MDVLLVDGGVLKHVGDLVGYVSESVVMGGSGWRSGCPCVSISVLSKENIVLDGDGVNWDSGVRMDIVGESRSAWIVRRSTCRIGSCW